MVTTSEFIVDYDDFTGGLFVGANQQQQPKNTFVGDNMISCEADGTLMPAAAWVPRSDAAVAAYVPAFGRMTVFQEVDVHDLFAVSATFLNILQESAPQEILGHAWNTGGRLGWGLGGATAPGSGFVKMDNYVLFPVWATPAPNDSMTHIGPYPSIGIANNNIGTNRRLQFPVIFGEFIVGAGSITNGTAAGSKIHWSNPSDPLNPWPAANFLQVGSTGYPITSLLVVGDSLMVGKAEGWYQITGVLGQNETVRQVSTEGPRGTASFSADGALMFPGRLHDGSAIRVLRGSVVQTMAVQETPTPTYNNCYTIGGFTFATGVGDVGGDFILGRSPTGRWFRLDATHQRSTKITAFADGPSDHPYAYAYLGATTAAGFPYRMLLAPVSPPLNDAGNAYTSATARLAEYKRTSRFRINQVVLELDLGTTTVNAQRSVSVRVATPHVAASTNTLVAPYDAAGSTTQTLVLPAAAGTSGQRVTHTFELTDGMESYSFIPEVTLQGVKLRRMMVRCSDVAGGR